MNIPWKKLEAPLIIFFTGLPIGILLCLLFPNWWWIAIPVGILFGISQYLIWLFFKLVSRKRIDFFFLFLLTIIVGIIVGGFLSWKMKDIPYGEWYKEISPTEDGVDIYFATKSFYCMELISGEKWCCGYIEQYDSERIGFFRCSQRGTG